MIMNLADATIEIGRLTVENDKLADCVLRWREKYQIANNNLAKSYMENDADYFEALLNKYGPEGLYTIANKLKEIADKDVDDALM